MFSCARVIRAHFTFLPLVEMSSKLRRMVSANQLADYRMGTTANQTICTKSQYSRDPLIKVTLHHLKWAIEVRLEVSAHDKALGFT